MITYGNFPSDQKIYATDALECFRIWPASKCSSQTRLAPSLVLWLLLAKRGRSDLTNPASRCWDELMLLAVAGVTGGAPGTGLQAQGPTWPCPWPALRGEHRDVRVSCPK